jgi:hypothetical protein
MKLARTFAITLAAVASFGLVGMTAPAHASDISWGYDIHKQF